MACYTGLAQDASYLYGNSIGVKRLNWWVQSRSGSRGGQGATAPLW